MGIFDNIQIVEGPLSKAAEQKEPVLIPFPQKKYQIIYADPPWKYEDKAASGKRGAQFKYDVWGNEV
jgi:hypothetical protein